MSDEERNLALQNAILGWQKKYNIHDGDPLLASLELFQIYFGSIQLSNDLDFESSAASSRPSFGEFRDAMEFLDRRCKQLVKLAQELTEASHKSSPAKRSSRGWFFAAMLLGALIVGIFIGKCLE